MCNLVNDKTDLDEFHSLKNDRKFLNVKLKIFKRDNNRDFHIIQINANQDSVFEHFLQLRIQLGVPVGICGRDRNWSTAQYTANSKEVEEQNFSRLFAKNLILWTGQPERLA